LKSFFFDQLLLLPLCCCYFDLLMPTSPSLTKFVAQLVELIIISIEDHGGSKTASEEP
jgi:hypothetical protein